MWKDYNRDNNNDNTNAANANCAKKPIENSNVALHEKRPRKKGCVNATDIVNNRARKLRARAEEARKNSNK